MAQVLKSITFIMLLRYKIVDGVHKLQPRPEFLIAQVRGLFQAPLPLSDLRSAVSSTTIPFLGVLQ